MDPEIQTVRIASVQIENTKCVKAFHLEPSPEGLTIIGGRNGQGKTSVLNSIAWTLGGNRRAPSEPHREGAMSTPEISLTLDNGIVVERRGKNSSLHVTDPTGKKAGQSLLDSFVSEFALDLPNFMAANAKEKAKILLRILGIGDQLTKIDAEEQTLYNSRHAIGQIADQKKAHAEELPEYADAPAEPVRVSDLIAQQQAVLARNGENHRLRTAHNQIVRDLADTRQKINEIEFKLTALRGVEEEQTAQLAESNKTVEQLHDESTAELEQQIADFEAINAQVAANQQKAAAADEAEEYKAQYTAKTQEIEAVRAARLALLDGANFPLPGLSVEDHELTYQGRKWDCMSGSEQLRVGVAIVRQLKPQCGFVLMDKLEQMDLDTLREFGEWLATEGLQVIATRVSTGDECSIVIEDGLPAGKTYADVVTGVDASTPKNTGEAMDW